MTRRLTAGKSSCECLCERTYGCSVSEYWAIRGAHVYRRSPVEAFIVQRHSAKERGVDWRLSLPQWWKIWEESGRWGQRGCHLTQYVMARYGDIGPYATGNVYVCTNTENCREARVRTNAILESSRTLERALKAAERLAPLRAV